MELFNHEQFLPIILPCGHTICKSCIKRILHTPNPVCSFDREKIDPNAKLSLNYSLLEIIDQPETLLQSNPKPANQLDPHCMQNHSLSLISNISEINLPEIQSLCTYCKLPCIEEFLYCDKCTYLLCEVCSKDEQECQHQVGRKIYCRINHELKFYMNSPCFYSRKNKKSMLIRCDLCSFKYFGGSWACRPCQFDLCFNCFNLINAGAALKCPDGHIMDPCFFDEQVAFECLACDDYGKFGYECCLCAFRLCEKCVYYFSKAQVNHKICCPKGNGLVLSDDPSTLFRSLFEPTMFICEFCEKNTFPEKVFNCVLCKFMVCQSCKDEVVGIEGGTGIKCDLNHDMKFVFNLNYQSRNLAKNQKSSGECCLCNNLLHIKGSFSCLKCDYHICKECYDILSISLDKLSIIH